MNSYRHSPGGRWTFGLSGPRRTLFALGLLVLLGIASPVRAAVIQVGSVSETAFGNQLAGTTVTVTFANGDFEKKVWQAGVGQAGAATGTNWSLSLNGDTFGGIFGIGGSSFVLTNTRTQGGGIGSAALIKSVLIEPLASGNVFDMAFGNSGFDEGTPGSNIGTTFNGAVGDGLSYPALTFVLGAVPASSNLTGSTYLDLVAVGGQPPVGDLRGSLLINFTSVSALGVTVGGLPGNVSGLPTTFIFGADTDLVTAAVPEPTSLALFGLACAGAGYVGWRRRRQPAPV